MNVDNDEPSAVDLSDGTVKSVAVAVRILEALANAGAPIRLAELARSVDMPRARVHRHLRTLLDLGLVNQERGGERYGLGWKLFQLGQTALEQFEIRRLAERHMHALRDTFGQTVVLSAPANGEALVVAVVESDNVVTISVRPGTRLPPLDSAQGRIAVAYSEETLRDQLIESRKKEASSDSPGSLERQLDTIRKRLYEFSSGETLLGINALAAPILAAGDELAGVLAVVGAAEDVQDDQDQIVLIQQHAAALSSRLGSTAYAGIGLPSTDSADRNDR